MKRYILVCLGILAGYDAVAQGIFSGSIYLPSMERCWVTMGTHSKGVTCAPVSRLNGDLILRLDYSKLGLASSPICTFTSLAAPDGTGGVKIQNWAVVKHTPTYYDILLVGEKGVPRLTGAGTLFLCSVSEAR